ncbi:unnamed protein product [Dicrocoelium dendriticum]|nr:unnamed protein product [Dicrocoelium dendriticum]
MFRFITPLRSTSLPIIDENQLPPPEVTYNSERGVKTIVQHYFNEDGDLIKETREYRTEKRIVAARIAQRTKWAKFGAAKNDPPGGNSANTYPAELVTMQLIQARQPEQDQDRSEEDALKAKNRVQQSLCRFCKGSHFSHKCPNKSDMEAMEALREKLKSKTDPAEENKDVPETVVSTGRYLPPPLRNAANMAAALSGSTGSEKRSFDGHTVRVSNLPSDTVTEDLKLIFSPFGQVTRIYPAKDKVTQQNRVSLN